MNNKKQLFKFFLSESILFSLTFFLGILGATKSKKIFSLEKIEIPQISLFNFLLSFAIATLFVFFLTKFLKSSLIKGKIYKTLFVLTSLFSGTIFFEIFFGEPIALILMLFFVFWWLKKPNVLNQNLLMIFGISGICSILGLSFKPENLILILILLSIYDFLAVYKTRHMVEIAKGMIEQKIIFGFVIPPDFLSFGESVEKIEPGGKFLILGGGDVAFPLLLSVSLIPFGILKATIVSIFSLIGLFFSFLIFFFQKERKPIPALPPIAFFSIIGFLITSFI